MRKRDLAGPQQRTGQPHLASLTASLPLKVLQDTGMGSTNRHLFDFTGLTFDRSLTILFT